MGVWGVRGEIEEWLGWWREERVGEVEGGLLREVQKWEMSI